MARSDWEFELDGKQHAVQFEHTYFAGKRTLIVDGTTVLESPGKLLYILGLDLGSKHDFQIGQHNCSVLVGCNGITYSYSLLVDGTDINKGAKPQPPIPEPD